MRVRFSLPAHFMKPKVLVIVGPTASGKSALAVKMAGKFNGEIISADSRQVYKGLNIGTGKITKSEMKGIPHHLLDVADPKKQFTVAEYKELAEEKIEEILGKGKMPIIVGGTGFYIQALTMTLPSVPANPHLRTQLFKKTAPDLYKMLKKLDKNRAKDIDKHNRVRLVRAIEVAMALGKVPKMKIVEQYDFIYIGLKPKDLDKRIYERLLQRIPNMIKEAESLHTKGLSWKRMEELGLEYRYLSRLLQKKLTHKEFVEKLYSEIKKYAKRQMTWFKKNKEINWFDSPADAYATTQLLLAQPRPAR